MEFGIMQLYILQFIEMSNFNLDKSAFSIKSSVL